MIHAVRRARKLKGIQIASARIIDVPEDIKQLVDQSKLEALHKRFRAFDTDSSSFIDSTELTPLLQSLGFNPTEERVREILSSFDTDNTGTLTFGEFVEVWAYYCQEAQSEADIIRKSFTFLLQNDSQAISFSEFRDAMMSTGNPLTDVEVRRFFALCDDESDGILRLDEFLKVLYSQPSLDMSLTRMSDSQQGCQVMHDLFACSNRRQRRSLASSISSHSQCRPQAMTSIVEAQLKAKVTDFPVGVCPAHDTSDVNYGAAAMVSQRMNAFEAIVEDPDDALTQESVSTTVTVAGSGHFPHLTTEEHHNSPVRFRTEATLQDAGHVQIHQCTEASATVGLGSHCLTHCTGLDASACQEQVGAADPILVQAWDQCDVGERRLVSCTEVTPPDKPVATSSAICEPRRNGVPAALPSLPSHVHRKLEAMSAKTVQDPQRFQNYDISSLAPDL